MELPPHVQRMREEGEQLSERVAKLATFCSQNIMFFDLSDDEQTLMQIQLASMTTYLNVLTMRTKIALSKLEPIK